MLSLARERYQGRCIPGGSSPSICMSPSQKILKWFSCKAACESWCSSIGQPRDKMSNDSCTQEQFLEEGAPRTRLPLRLKTMISNVQPIPSPPVIFVRLYPRNHLFHELFQEFHLLINVDHRSASKDVSIKLRTAPWKVCMLTACPHQGPLVVTSPCAHANESFETAGEVSMTPSGCDSD